MIHQSLLTRASLLAVFFSSAIGQRIEVPITEFKLENGLNVILHEDHSLPTVSVNVWYHVGSGREKPGRTGFAHLFEHILFEGSANVPEGMFDRWLEEAGVRFSMGKHKGPFTASASVQNDSTDKAVGEFMNELNSIQENITEEEIKRAGNYVALCYPSRFETIGDYAIQMASLVSMELPLTTFNDYTDGILDVSVDEALISAKKYIDTDNLVIVIVGDREKVESGIRDLELGAINLWTVNDVLGLPPSME